MEEIMNNDEIFEEEILEGTVEETESGHGLGKAVAIGCGLGISAITALLIKKHHDKKAGKPKKQKTRLKLVRVPVEEEDFVTEDVDEAAVETEE